MVRSKLSHYEFMLTFSSSNMLYPKEDPERRELSFSCRTCTYHEEPSSACIYRNDLSNTVGETAGITQDVGQDPTVRASFDSSPAVSFGNVPSRVLDAEFPCTCTVCGQEIICETCGKPTAMGCWLEVDDDETETYVFGDDRGSSSLVRSMSQLDTSAQSGVNSIVIGEDFEHEYMSISDPVSEDDEYG